MSKLVSVAVSPAQPDRMQYGVLDLAVFRHTNSIPDYVKAWGEAPPPPEASLRPKTWFDSSAADKDPEEPCEYRVIQKVKGVWQVTTVHIAAFEAARVNLFPGSAVAIYPGEVPTAQEAARRRPAWPVPIRELLPNERITVLAGDIPAIVRTDMEEDRDKASGKFLESDRAMLKEILALLGKR